MAVFRRTYMNVCSLERGGASPGGRRRIVDTKGVVVAEVVTDSEAQGAEEPGAAEQRRPVATPARRRATRSRSAAVQEEALERLLEALRRQRDGDFSARVAADGDGIVGELIATFNGV